MNALIQIWRAYRQCPIGSRLRVIGRYVLCPYPAILRSLPPSGRILEVGCGDGLLFFLLSRIPGEGRRDCVGVDPDERKIAVARRAEIPDAQFRVGDGPSVASGSADVVAVIDVLYLIPQSGWKDFLADCVRILSKGGLLLVKEATDRPRWKHWVAYLEEILAIHVVGMTKGNEPHFEPVEVYRRAIEEAGAEVFKIERVDGGRPHAHVLFLARKKITNGL